MTSRFQHFPREIIPNLHHYTYSCKNSKSCPLPALEKEKHWKAELKQVLVHHWYRGKREKL